MRFLCICCLFVLYVLVFLFVFFLFVFCFAHVCFCHFFSSCWCRGLAAVCDYGTPWAFLLTSFSIV